MYLFTSRTAGDHCHSASAAKPAARIGHRPPALASTAGPRSRTGARARRTARRAGRRCRPSASRARARASTPSRVEDRAPAERRLLARQHEQAREREERDRDVRRGGERRPAALGEGPREEHRRDERGGGDREALAALGAVAALRDRVGHARQRQEQAGDRAAQRAERPRTGSPASSGAAGARAARRARTRRRCANGSRLVKSRRGGGGAEPDRAPAGAVVAERSRARAAGTARPTPWPLPPAPAAA